MLRAVDSLPPEGPSALHRVSADEGLPCGGSWTWVRTSALGVVGMVSATLMPWNTQWRLVAERDQFLFQNESACPVIASVPGSSVSELVGAHGVLCVDAAAMTQWAGGCACLRLTHPCVPLFSRSVIRNH